MNLKEKEEYVIDEFYNENEYSYKIKSNDEECDEIRKKLDLVHKKLSVLDKDFDDINIDIMAVIEKADEIKERKRLKKDLVKFVLTAVIILSFYTYAIVLAGSRTFIIFQILCTSFMPWLIIPITLRRRGEI
ncbi:DUF5345 family protein [Fervidicella metallireducens]|uniref:DUF5345 family protein n=1 Tax=Fervidicella metallireducens TaxID=655338 RepID=UPI000552DEDC|nr:DUF5345 family protein [Fervidicella metallireducens]